MMILCLVTSSANAGETVTYTYDALGRLVSVSHSGGPNSGVSSGYAYDAAGNRTNVKTTTPSSGGNCTFSVHDENFGYDWEFPSNGLAIWIDIAGTCTAPTTINYTFSGPGMPSGNFVIQPGQTSYYYYYLPVPCSYAGSGSFSTSISIASGPGSIADNAGSIHITDC
ncbi:hypothetical protein BRX40_01805 [Sphingomonas koreensis]|jgi:YD repeat-containing protein|nr:hypothetical protein BRX40_01805 [Sphingomonas koreensis]